MKDAFWCFHVKVNEMNVTFPSCRSIHNLYILFHSHRIHVCMVYIYIYLYTFIVDLYGFHVGKYIHQSHWCFLGCFLETVCPSRGIRSTRNSTAIGFVTSLQPFAGLGESQRSSCLGTRRSIELGNARGPAQPWEDEGLRNTRSFGVIFFVTKPRLRIISRRNGGN